MASADQLAAEMESFYRQYIEVFNGGDLTALAGLFSFPCGLLSGKRGMNVLKDEAAFVQMMENAKAELKSQGWTRTGIDQTRAWPTAADMGLLISDFTRGDGSALMHGRACYTLRRDGSQWKIATIMNVARPFLGPSDLPR
jgi:hypothetical protein